MKLVVLDFETYYDKRKEVGYSVSSITTHEYINDPRFEVIGMSIGTNGKTPQWYDNKGGKVEQMLPPQEWWNDAIMVSHNVKFDGAILAWKYDRKPKAYIDTMALMQCTGAMHFAGASLAAGADFLNKRGIAVPFKGDEVVKANGKRLADFNEYELGEYGRYCVTDSIICGALLNYFLPLVPKDELWWQDCVAKMFIEREFYLDAPLLEQDYLRVKTKKKQILDSVVAAVGAGTRESLLKDLGSGKKLADLLVRFGGDGFEVPMKRSPKTQKMTYAFAKTDEEMRALTEHPNEVIAELASARLGVKSNIEENRLARFIGMGRYNPIGFPLKVSGAHTHRLGGSDMVNAQNMPSGRIKGQSTVLRDSILAPEGHVILSADSSQIECRLLNYVAGQESDLEVFRKKQDPFSVMASYMFGTPAEEIIRLKNAGDEYGKWMRAAGKATVLGCGYQMGAKKFKTAALNTYGVTLTEAQAKLGVDTYRATHPMVVQFWQTCSDVLIQMLQGGSGYFGGPNGDMFFFDGSRQLFGERVPGIRLPDGMWLNYFNLRQGTITVDGEEKQAIVYDKREGRAYKKTAIYGGRLAENLIQAAAFSLLKYQAKLISKKYPVKMNVHDEWWGIVLESLKHEAAKYLHDCMCTTPEWAPGLPLACEVECGRSYGKSERIL